MSSPTYCPPLSYYVGLFTSQYRTGNPKSIQGWFAVCMQPIADINTCVAGLNEDFDIDSAVGVQLDAVGLILGQSRIMPFQPSMSVSPILDDDTYRVLLYAKRGINTWNGKIQSLYPLWRILFPTGSIIFIDNQNMTATVILSGAFSSIETDLITNGLIVPRPEGVLYTYDISSNLPLFGADLDNAFIAGADVGFTAP